MRSERAITIFLLVSASIVVLLITCMEPRRGPHVEFIVPDGFHGVFVIKHDKLAGTPPEQTGNHIRYTIPRSGVLKTSNIDPFPVWHSESAHFAGGKEVSQLTSALSQLKSGVGVSASHTAKPTCRLLAPQD